MLSVPGERYARRGRHWIIECVAPPLIRIMMLGISPAFPAALSVAAFERMSEKVEQLEAEADVSKQLALTSSTGKGTSLESKFKQVRHP